MSSNDPIKQTNYCEAIREGFVYLLDKYPEVFIIGQGLWSPWYVGGSMNDLDKNYGVSRILDSPVSELACTGAAVGASLCGYRPIVVHPRMDFMLLATDQIINQAAKWSYMFAGKSHAKVTIRGIINRGGEQGAQHSQALHAMYAHIPGLRVLMPATASDARDLLIAAVLCDDPVLYIDDRWLYEQEAILPTATDISIHDIKPKVLHEGHDITLVGNGYSTLLCQQAAQIAEQYQCSVEVIDLRMLNPLILDPIIDSVNKTGHLCVVDGGWRNCGMASEIVAGVVESEKLIKPLQSKPQRLTLTDCPAPTSKTLEADYYPNVDHVLQIISAQIGRKSMAA